MSDTENSKKQCATCGKLYKVCFTCESERAKGHEFWRATACSPECYQVHLVLSNYYYKFISKAEAKSYLGQLLEDKMLPYSDNARALIEEIIKDDAPALLDVHVSTPNVDVSESIDNIDEPDVIVDDYASLYED
jgi:hypothetical protein